MSSMPERATDCRGARLQASSRWLVRPWIRGCSRRDCPSTPQPVPPLPATATATATARRASLGLRRRLRCGNGFSCPCSCNRSHVPGSTSPMPEIRSPWHADEPVQRVGSGARRAPRDRRCLHDPRHHGQGMRPPVSVTERWLRLNRLTPSADSSSRIDRLMAGWVKFNSWAASVKDSYRAAVSKTGRCLAERVRSGSSFMPLFRPLEHRRTLAQGIRSARKLQETSFRKGDCRSVGSNFTGRPLYVT